MEAIAVAILAILSGYSYADLSADELKSLESTVCSHLDDHILNYQVTYAGESVHFITDDEGNVIDGYAYYTGSYEYSDGRQEFVKNNCLVDAANTDDSQVYLDVDYHTESHGARHRTGVFSYEYATLSSSFTGRIKCAILASNYEWSCSYIHINTPTTFASGWIFSSVRTENLSIVQENALPAIEEGIYLWEQSIF